jgi:hypothetical protein
LKRSICASAESFSDFGAKAFTAASRSCSSRIAMRAACAAVNAFSVAISSLSGVGNVSEVPMEKA